MIDIYRARNNPDRDSFADIAALSFSKCLNVRFLATIGSIGVVGLTIATAGCLSASGPQPSTMDILNSTFDKCQVSGQNSSLKDVNAHDTTILFVNSSADNCTLYGTHEQSPASASDLSDAVSGARAGGGGRVSSGGRVSGGSIARSSGYSYSSRGSSFRGVSGGSYYFLPIYGANSGDDGHLINAVGENIQLSHDNMRGEIDIQTGDKINVANVTGDVEFAPNVKAENIDWRVNGKIGEGTQLDHVTATRGGDSTSAIEIGKNNTVKETTFHAGDKVGNNNTIERAKFGVGAVVEDDTNLKNVTVGENGLVPKGITLVDTNVPARPGFDPIKAVVSFVGGLLGNPQPQS